MSTDRWGVDDGYLDAAGRWQTVAPDSVSAVHRAMGIDHSGSVGATEPVRVVRTGERAMLTAHGVLTLEDGTGLSVEGDLPPDLPLGYHELRLLDDEEPTRLIVSPGRCHLPADLHTWGLSVQLYAARSRASWGMGDLGDLSQLAEWTGRRGAGVIALNPLHGALPIDRQQPSPYTPSTRRWMNPLYLRIEDLPGAADEPGLPALAAAGRALNDGARIDRDAVYRVKLDALERLWRRFPGSASFEAFCTRHGDDLAGYATFCALAEHHQSGWSSWPAPLRRPEGPAVARFAAENAHRVRFHSWLQWLLDEQLAGTGADDLVVADLAVGVDPDGADAWAWQDTLALDARVGAPPDDFNTLGQDWALPPFVPWRLRSAGYEPFVQTIRAAFRRACGIRIDHVMGLFRLFWIPPGFGPRQGTYVHFPGRELLDIVALESARANAFVVGEDLGTVDEAARARLAAAAVLSYRLVWFEPGDPEEYPRQALAAVTTHDLATVAGLWSGTDLAAQRALDLAPNEEGTAEMREHLAALTGATGGTPVDEVIERVYERLARAPSMVVTATLDDALAVEERPNMPGTIDEWPNWSIPLPRPIDDLADDRLANRVVDAVARRGPGSR